jgi:hypothetical protein
MNYQVMLTDDADQPLVDQPVDLVFRLYESERDGPARWSEEHSTTTNSIGVVSVVLGGVTPLVLDDFSVPLWLEVEVNTEILGPRRELTSAPYALVASNAELLGGVAPEAYSLDGHEHDAEYVNEGQVDAVTADMVVPDVVSSVDGVSNDGGDIDLVAGSNVSIVPDDVANTITISATPGGEGGDITGVDAGQGLTGGGATGDVVLDIGAGDGIDVAADAVSVDVSDFAGGGLIDEGSNDLGVSTGTGLQVSGDAVGLTSSYADGSTYDGRFVNEDQANSVTTGMIVPSVLSSVDGVTNDGGGIDLLEGSNITITPDDGANTITISAAGGGDDGDWTVLGDNVYRLVGGVGVGTTVPRQKLHVHGTSLCYLQLTNTATGDGAGDGLRIGLNGVGATYIGEDEGFGLKLGSMGSYTVGVTSSGLYCSGAMGASGTLTADGGLRIPDGAAIGRVLTSDALGGGSWQSVDHSMVSTDIVSSVDGVVNDGGNIDLVAGPNVTITPDDGANTITISAGAGGDDGDWTISGDNVYRSVGRVGIGTSTPGHALQVHEETPASSAFAHFTNAATGSAPDAGLVVGVVGTGDAMIALENSKSLYIGTGGTGADITVAPDGDVGIGMAVSPDARLDVEAASGYAGHFEGGDGLLVETSALRAAEFRSDYPSSDTYVLHAEYVGTGYDHAVAVRGTSTPIDYYGIGGEFEGGYMGVRGLCDGTESDDYIATYGKATGVYANGSNTYGVYGRGQDGEFNYGVWGEASGDHASITNYGVYGRTIGSSATNWAGYFNGGLYATSASASVKSFRIDHPLEPERKYLNHSSVESSEMMNIYNGNVVLDADGSAWVELPDWFEALNGDFRYQLTPIGAPGPDLHVADVISGNRFRIAGGETGMTVSWQVTGIRHDPVAEVRRIQVEEEKRASEIGRYLNPEAYGASRESGIGYQPPPDSEERLEVSR